METRYLNVDDPIFETNIDDMSSEFFGRHWPIPYKFFPTEEMSRKLIMRMTQIKDTDKDLWQAFIPEPELR